jgi:hypothetical protein
VYAAQVPDTVPIAELESQQGAEEAADLLRANGIRCAVVDPMNVGPFPSMGGGHVVVVAVEDEAVAREALEGFVLARWFLCTASGERFHAFETATADLLRRQSESQPYADGASTTQLRRLSELLTENRLQRVADAFASGDALEGRTLDEWAAACACERAHAGD